MFTKTKTRDRAINRKKKCSDSCRFSRYTFENATSAEIPSGVTPRLIRWEYEYFQPSPALLVEVRA